MKNVQMQRSVKVVLLTWSVNLWDFQLVLIQIPSFFVFPLQEFKGVSFQPLLFFQFLVFGYLFPLQFVTVNLFKILL